METRRATHYYPIDDRKIHTTQNEFCWCKPIVDRKNKQVIHIAADCREFFNSNDLNPNVQIYEGTPHFIFFQGATSH